MSSDGSVTLWIGLVKDGDSVATQALWERYFPKLVRLARRKLAGVRRAAADEDDVAASALKSFCLAAEHGRFPDLADRDSLWRLLLQITARKAIDQRRHARRERRGGGKVLGESVLTPAVASSDGRINGAGLAAVVGNEPSPEIAAIMAEEFRGLLDGLGDADLRTIAVAAMEGYSNEEIAQRLNCAVRTVERRRELIRKKWERE